jgi:hypothetical protein
MGADAEIPSYDIHTHPNPVVDLPFELNGDRDVQSFYKLPFYIIGTNGFNDLDGRIGSRDVYFNGTKSLIKP